MTCANVLVGRVKDCEGWGPGRCWTGDGGAAICVAPVKGATRKAVDIGKLTLISIHAPRRERQHQVTVIVTDQKFQSTLPRRERQAAPEGVQSAEEFQSTLPRRERQTHPADYRLVRNFNPRSREGSDGHPSRRLRYPPYFNPRSREGSDPEPQHTAAEIHISIHAPAKGATGYDLAPLGRNAISIHAPAKGATVAVK